MRIFIAGGSGFIGNILLDYFSKEHETHGSFYANPAPGLTYFDMADRENVKKTITRLKPDVIIHPAFNSNVEYCEENPKETWHMNVEGSKNVIEAARDIGSKFVFFSSDYVFDGSNGPYSEEDAPNPINEYGKQKLAVENIINDYLSDHLIIRTTVVYGWEIAGKNFCIRLIKNLKENKSMKVPFDQIGSPTYALNMVQAVKDLVETDKRGIYHVVGSDLMDRYTFARNVAEVFELDECFLIPVSTSELRQKARRPLHAGMKNDKVQKEISTKLMGVKDGLEEMKRNRR
ncbi:GDP-L-fucose synthase [uncultured archaeon]|nr:GDP-L-fucose synthase [uncultured archaeon]